MGLVATFEHANTVTSPKQQPLRPARESVGSVSSCGTFDIDLDTGNPVTAPPSQVWYPLADKGNSTSLLGSNEQQERRNFEQGDAWAELDVRALSAGDLLQERPRRGSL